MVGILYVISIVTDIEICAYLKKTANLPIVRFLGENVHTRLAGLVIVHGWSVGLMVSSFRMKIPGLRAGRHGVMILSKTLFSITATEYKWVLANKLLGVA